MVAMRETLAEESNRPACTRREAGKRHYPIFGDGTPWRAPADAARRRGAYLRGSAV